jgi:hypothetical protein
VNIDDCWLAHERDRRGLLQPDPVRQGERGPIHVLFDTFHEFFFSPIALET